MADNYYGHISCIVKSIFFQLLGMQYAKDAQLYLPADEAAQNFKYNSHACSKAGDTPEIKIND